MDASTKSWQITLKCFLILPAVVLNERIFYFGSPYSGLQRSIDGGKSWDDGKCYFK